MAYLAVTVGEETELARGSGWLVDERE